MWKTKLSRKLPTLLISLWFRRRVYVPGSKPLKNPMLNEVAKPQAIRGRAVELHKKAVLILRVLCPPCSSTTNTFWRVVIRVVLDPGAFVPQDEFHHDLASL